MMRRITGAISAVILVAACAGSPAPNGTSATPGQGSIGPGATRPGTAIPAESASPLATAPSGTVDPTSVFIRAVNLWVGPDGPGGRVGIVVDEDEPPLATADFGQVSDFVAVPRTGDGRYESINGYPMEDIQNQTGLELTYFDAGNRMTAVFYGFNTFGSLAARVFWEVGAPPANRYLGHGPAWPEAASGAATILVFTHATVPLGRELGPLFVASGGSCLRGATTGSPVTEPVAPDEPAFFAVDAGTHEITFSESGCAGSPAFPPVSITVSAGDRVGLFPFGANVEELRALVLTMGSQP